MAEPTILVKKIDGASVRMALADFRAYQKSRKRRSADSPKHHDGKQLPKPKDWEQDDHRSLLEENLPAVAWPHELSTSAPVKSIFVEEAKAEEAKHRPIGQGSFVRPVMHDIAPPKEKKSMGPEEEFAAFSLTDFWRLSPGAETTAARLKEKFSVWREESYGLFLAMRSAWRKSPLYRMYIDAAVQSLREQKRLPDLLAVAERKNQFTMDVFLAVAAVNRYLST